MNDVYLRALIASKCLRFRENVKRMRKGLAQLKDYCALIRQIEVLQRSVDDSETAERLGSLYARENLE